MVSLVECFWSLQGEGPWVGAPTLFVRTAGCPLRCTYCDTVESYEAPPDFEVRDLEGDVVVTLPNPSRSEDLLKAPWFQPRGRNCWLSVTGGEPLLWPGFCHEIFEGARDRGFRTLLETAALDADALATALPAIDHLAMDFKLPSTLGGGEHRAEDHAACLALAMDQEVETSVKVVLTPGISMNELQAGLSRIQPWREGFCLVLQPVTPCLHETLPLGLDRLRSMVTLALDMDFRVRVLPQVHKSLGLA